MTDSQLVLLAAWFGAAVAATFTVLWVIPTLFRMRFVLESEKLRDECMDHVLAGELPMSPPVADFLYVQDIFINKSAHLALGRLIVTMMAYDQTGWAEPDSPSFNQLSAPQRKVMHGLQKRSESVVGQFVRNGSPMSWVMWLSFWVRRLMGNKRKPGVQSEAIAVRVQSEAWEQARQELHPSKRAARRRARNHRGPQRPVFL